MLDGLPQQAKRLGQGTVTSQMPCTSFEGKTALRGAPQLMKAQQLLF